MQALIALAVIMLGSGVDAQSLPSAADSSRLHVPAPILSTPGKTSVNGIIYNAVPTVAVPSQAKEICFLLNDLSLKGNSAFDANELRELYAPYLKTRICVNQLWEIAGRITAFYRSHHYFLSRAYVPAQEINNGNATIQILEGYVFEVEKDASVPENENVTRIIDSIKQQIPISAEMLEEAILRLSDLPGLEFTGVIMPLKNAPEGGVKLLLKSQKEAGRGLISVDNYGSRYLGPYTQTTSYQRSFIPDQLTTLYFSSSIPPDELLYGAINQDITLSPEWSMILAGNYVKAKPGATLTKQHIISDSQEITVGVKYQPIRQRRKNLSVTMNLAAKNTSSDIFDDVPLTRDRIRALRTIVSYDAVDSWGGYNTASATLNQGLGLLGASKTGNATLSRAEADPDFTSLNFNYLRQQRLSETFVLSGELNSQLSSSPLFSSEEFGYGGHRMGRSYDPSELTGDNGVSASVELSYYGIPAMNSSTVAPYVFYDVGRVWNLDKNGENTTGSSTGAGVRFAHSSGVSADIGVAFPMIHKIDKPIYGEDNPRFMLKLSYGF